MARRGRPRKDGAVVDQTDKHIIMQLKSLVDLHGEYVVEFRNGDKDKVPFKDAWAMLVKYSSLTGIEKLNLQDFISYSKKNFYSALT